MDEELCTYYLFGVKFISWVCLSMVIVDGGLLFGFYLLDLLTLSFLSILQSAKAKSWESGP